MNAIEARIKTDRVNMLSERFDDIVINIEKAANTGTNYIDEYDITVGLANTLKKYGYIVEEPGGGRFRISW